jgi:EAL domain-containing protein (putative c-di-GMP-specific phosphodiesterase class I)
MQHVMQARLAQIRDLRRALTENQFVLHYQPIIDLRSGCVVGTEALLRWQHPSRGLVYPGDFIDLVEQGDLAVPLGSWVIETSIAQAVAWRSLATGGEPLRMSVTWLPGSWPTRSSSASSPVPCTSMACRPATSLLR